jgi:putative restriction endonuclease
MTPLLPHIKRVRLEKAAWDNGLDQSVPTEGDWLAFSSTKTPLWVWLGIDPTGRPVAAFSQLHVATALAPMGLVTDIPMPLGARAVLAVADVEALHPLLRRAYQLSRSLPDEPLRLFEAETKRLPRGTEAERLVIQRVGQDIFRDGLLEFWDRQCAITGLAVPELLRASHIKPWADCETDAERLDVFNGLLLAPNVDAAFDGGFITVADDGSMVVSPLLVEGDVSLLGLDVRLHIRAPGLDDRHRAFLPWHREHVFLPRQTLLKQRIHV